MSAVDPRHVLLAGFEPFAGDSLNPSREIAKALDGRRVGDLDIHAMVLPVEHEAARALVAPALDAPGLAAVVHLGLAGGRARVALERVAVNCLDYRIPDAQGRQLRDDPCVEGGPAAYWTTLPLRDILAALVAEGIPAYASYTAGTYLCNFTLYTTLHALAGSLRPVPAGFIHLPFLPAMVAAHDLEEPSMDVAVSRRAVEIALDVIATSLRPGTSDDPLAGRRGATGR